jgi:hypothetical protein
MLDQSNADSIFTHQHREKHVCITSTIFIPNKYDSLSTTVSFINKSYAQKENMKIFAILLIIATTAFTFSFAADEDKKGMFLL